jgi:hypothetical protein
MGEVGVPDRCCGSMHLPSLVFLAGSVRSPGRRVKAAGFPCWENRVFTPDSRTPLPDRNDP